jgi:hypothetical protein
MLDIVQGNPCRQGERVVRWRGVRGKWRLPPAKACPRHPEARLFSVEILRRGIGMWQRWRGWRRQWEIEVAQILHGFQDISPKNIIVLQMVPALMTAVFLLQCVEETAELFHLNSVYIVGEVAS